MVGGGTGASYANSSGEYEIAAQRLRDWRAAVEAFSGTAEELFLLLDDFEAWAVVQPTPFRGYALSYIHSVRRSVEAEEERNKTAGQRKRGTVTESSAKQTPGGKGLYKLPEVGDKIPGTEGIIGEEYSIPGGSRKLKAHYYLAVERLIANTEVSMDIAKKNMADADFRARVELRDALGNWYDNVKAIWDDKVKKLPDTNTSNETLVLARIPINSCYRRLGETCDGDEHGALDSTDRYGHWRGFAVDVQNNNWGYQCYPELTEKEILEAAYAADLERPQYKDKEGKYKYRNDKKDEKGKDLGECGISNLKTIYCRKPKARKYPSEIYVKYSHWG